MIDYLIMELRDKKPVVMPIALHILERTAFVFTRRTKARLGGFNIYN